MGSAAKPSVGSTHSALSYEKWQAVTVSDDEDGEAKPLLPSRKDPAQVEADGEMYERYKALFKAHLKGKFPLALRKLLARFIAVQHRGTESSNIYRYSEIVGLISQRRAELMHDADALPALCELHKKIVNAAKEGEAGVGDVAQAAPK
mmetsp:Transcript_52558/g.120755  ORF Transcript_52558/g.120755 Transcript_52558/m.120755 type:complete len:148 (-) Transcript_52558:9-452(-)